MNNDSTEDGEYALSEYSIDQWWFQELEGIVSRDRLTEDQYRAINIARQVIPRLLSSLTTE